MHRLSGTTNIRRMHGPRFRLLTRVRRADHTSVAHLRHPVLCVGLADGLPDDRYAYSITDDLYVLQCHLQRIACRVYGASGFRGADFRACCRQSMATSILELVTTVVCYPLLSIHLRVLSDCAVRFRHGLRGPYAGSLVSGAVKT